MTLSSFSRFAASDYTTAQDLCKIRSYGSQQRAPWVRQIDKQPVGQKRHAVLYYAYRPNLIPKETMLILAVDVGTGTQDVLLLDTHREPENAFKLVMPSPTAILARRIRAATEAGEDLLLTGVMMGGGPCAWAAEGHLKAGNRVFATPDAARTFNDDLAEVQARGVTVVSDDEATRLAGARRLSTRDFDYAGLSRAFGEFGVDLDTCDVLAVGVFDHGAAPPGVSDRLFRFEYLSERVGAGQGLPGFAFAGDSIPGSMTRLQSVAASAPVGRPLVVMDTAPAAVLGALEDPVVQAQVQPMVTNLGNMHTLAFQLKNGAIRGLFEHHTGFLDREKLEGLLQQLADGSLSHELLFDDHGHGALLLDRTPAPLEFLAVTGPRRGILARSDLRPHFAVPHGDMMMAGCWGLVRACASVLPWTAPAIEAALAKP
jgi:uncharacterized protein (DUF1786 family)